MKKIIYTAGLRHSDSTVLDPALGCHPNIIGLGEIYAVFEKSTCSCGKKGADCDFRKNIKN